MHFHLLHAVSFVRDRYNSIVSHYNIIYIYVYISTSVCTDPQTIAKFPPSFLRFVKGTADRLI